MGLVSDEHLLCIHMVQMVDVLFPRPLLHLNQTSAQKNKTEVQPWFENGCLKSSSWSKSAQLVIKTPTLQEVLFYCVTHFESFRQLLLKQVVFKGKCFGQVSL